MDIPHEEFSHNPTLISILSHSFAVFFAAPKHFLTIAAALVLPLSSAILIHTLLAHPFIHHYLNKNPNPSLEAIAPFAVLQSIYLLALFALSLLSTAAVVYSAACLYTAKGLNFKTLISAIPRLLRPLFLTFVWASLIMFVYYFVFMICVVIAVVLFLPETDDDVRVVFAIFLISIVFGCLHVYISAVWHLASVIAVLEEGNYGLAAMKKSRELMKGKVKLAWLLVFVYLLCNAIIGMIFNGVVVRDKEEYGLAVRVIVGIVLVAVLMFVNLVGLLVQSVFYYACKAYHHQGIDKSALYEHLGGYLGEYVPLKSSIQMENL